MDQVAQVFENVRKDGRNNLLEPEAMAVCMDYGIPVPKFRLARTPEEALGFAEEVGYPLVLKIVSPQIVHKSDVGGVVAGIRTREEVGAAYRKILASVKEKAPDAKVIGILLEAMAAPATEVIIGSTKDAQFGPVLMFGLGGIFVEVLKDVTFRVAPITQSDAMEMITEVKGYQVLKGQRGQPAADVNKLVDILLRVSDLLVDHPEIKELDLNPVIVYADGAKTVDARIILE